MISRPAACWCSTPSVARNTPLLYPLAQLTNCSLGIPLALAAYAGLAWQGMRLLTGNWHRAAVAVVPVILVLILGCIVAAAKYPLTVVQYDLGFLHLDTIVLTCVEVLVPLLSVLAALFMPRRDASALVAFFVATYFIAAGLLYMKDPRYLEPIVPSLCVLAALLVAAMAGERAKASCTAPGSCSPHGNPVRPADTGLVPPREPHAGAPSACAAQPDVTGAMAQIRPGRWRRRTSCLLGGVVLLLTGCYGLAYQHIYAQPLTSNQAACWMYQHVSAGAMIMQDFPDELQPNGGYNGCDNGRVYTPLYLVAFLSEGLIDYRDDSFSKVQQLAPWLSRAQYYIINSERAIYTFQDYGNKYPYMRRFYRLLLGSKQGAQDALGYTLVYHVTEHAQLGPWTDVAHGASEDFDVFDHPPVWIFQNTGRLSTAEIVRVMTDDGHIADPTMPSAPATVAERISPGMAGRVAASAILNHTKTFRRATPAACCAG